MSTKSTGFWSVINLLLLVVTAGLVYLKVPAVKEAVDAKLPWLKETVARYTAAAPAAAPRAEVPPQTTTAAEPAAAETNAQEVASQPAPAATPAQSSMPVDLNELSKNPAQWPKSVELKKPVDFPAVLNGKVVGNVHVQPGAKAHLVMIKDGKLGLEYQGGGAWVGIDQTNLQAEIQNAGHTGKP